MSFCNNTVYRNGGRGYDFGQYTNPLIFKNNISYRNTTTDRFPAATVHDHNSWDASPSVTVSDADFVSVDTTGVSGPRVNGKLPVLRFLKLAAGSDLINAGTDVKLPYLGNAPDIGYNEASSAATSIPVNGITVTGASGATTISTDHGTLQLSAAILPANATNKTVTWTVQNGTGQATINTSGLVTAPSSGTVTARATATDGSGVSGSLVITISSQSVKVTGITVSGAGGATSIATNGGILQLSAAISPATLLIKQSHGRFRAEPDRPPSVLPAWLLHFPMARLLPGLLQLMVRGFMEL